ncbi:hypothetical protein HOY80DRAFT_1113319 [Tuber brumale]|nr:hypothetical protein HOY80DRAFT_1113319 [Tuber brumale]
MGGFTAVTFQFSRIGNNFRADQLLRELDQDRDIGRWTDIFPIEFDLKQQVEDKWFVWDAQDYHDFARPEFNLPTMRGDWESDSDWDD